MYRSMLNQNAKELCETGQRISFPCTYRSYSLPVKYLMMHYGDTKPAEEE